jgi:hypothetical protein
MIDQLVANMAAIEEQGKIPVKAVQQPMPVSVEDSVLGMHKRWVDVELKGVSLGPLAMLLARLRKVSNHQ